MDPNKTMDESSAEGKESEGKTEQVRKLLHAISLCRQVPHAVANAPKLGMLNRC